MKGRGEKRQKGISLLNGMRRSTNCLKAKRKHNKLRLSCSVIKSERKDQGQRWGKEGVITSLNGETRPAKKKANGSSRPGTRGKKVIDSRTA